MTAAGRPTLWGPTHLAMALFTMIGTTTADAQQSQKNRGDLLEELAQAETDYQSAPGDDSNRRVYADLLFKLGEFWKANDVIAPLAATSSTNTADLALGARLAYMTGDYTRAEVLFTHVRSVSDEDSEAHGDAAEGLMMVYYQTNQYAKARSVTLPEGADRSLLEFMQRFEGTPYQVEWASAEKVALLSFSTQDPLPLMTLEINGHSVEFILDTGGDRFVIDEAIAEQIGVDVLTTTTAKYAFTGGKDVRRDLGRVDSVKMGDVTLKNVPVVVLPWKASGPQSDGVLGTNVLRQFLSTVDYANDQLIFREKSEAGKQQLLASLEGHETVVMPFVLYATHLLFAQGSLNGHEKLIYLVDSGLAMSLPFISVDETLEYLDIEKTPLEGTPYFLFPIESIGLGPLRQGEAQGLSNVLVEENVYWGQGFIWDGLISHQFLRNYTSWTLDFDTMTFLFGME
ncbi:MAG: retropepsin-like domain-containing protein [Gemmatimonadetes bacterium]|nr:retropepsin-like domain-containing protein [Gemmatimonadota bacterium]